MNKLLLSTIIFAIILSNESFAVSESECAIWLCAPAGFSDSSCDSAHKAMHRRVHLGLPPLPPFSACNQNSTISISNSELTSYDGRAAFIPSHPICIEYKTETRFGATGRYETTQCIKYGQSNESWVKNTVCLHGNNGTTTPEGCTITGYYVEVYANGELVGDSYFFNL